MSLATTRQGHELLAFLTGAEPEIPENDCHVPLTFALVAASYHGEILFIFNRWKQEWELPGGMIETGERPDEAARRELAEETGQVVAPLNYVGLMKTRLQPDCRREYGALYAGEIETLRPFQANDEAEHFMFWDLRIDVEGYVSEIDAKLAELSVLYARSAADPADWNQIAATCAQSDSGDDRICQQLKAVIWESLGDLRNRDVLDLGCGHGWLSQRMAEAGAQVWGVDGAQALLNLARSRYPEIEFTQYDLAQGLPPTERQFDRVIAHMALMDIPDIDRLLAAVRDALKPDGRFLFTLPHPCFFNYRTGRDEQSGQWYRKVTGYLQAETWRIESFGGHNHYHRRLTHYIDCLRANQMAVTRLYEPMHIPGPNDDESWLAFYRSVPVFLFVEAMPIPDGR